VNGDRPGEQEAQAQEKEEEASIAGGDAAGVDAGRPEPFHGAAVVAEDSRSLVDLHSAERVRDRRDHADGGDRARRGRERQVGG
jgi:hypothetical protein